MKKNTYSLFFAQLFSLALVIGNPSQVMAADAVTSTAAWQSFQLSTQTGTFTAEFDAVPDNEQIYAVVTIQDGTISSNQGMSCGVLFFYSATAGDTQFLIRKAGSWTSVAKTPFTAGTSYHFRMEIDVTAHTYSVYCTPSGGSEITLATDYAFRNDTPVTKLTGWGMQSTTTTPGLLTVSNMKFTPTTGIGEASIIESGLQVYPNPFNTTTNIQYRMTDDGFVSLKIYDVQGREVAVLVNEYQPAGSYTAQCSAAGLPKGVYLAKVTINANGSGMPVVLTKKLVLTN